VRWISDRVLVMYLGQVVEIGAVDNVYREPRHPYTRALLASMPSMDPGKRTAQPALSGDPPNPIDPPPGCRFHTRCQFAEAVCKTRTPVGAIAPAAGDAVACHIYIPGTGHSAAKAEAA
jgi:peptide/nickel transport system ATP-binding protein